MITKSIALICIIVCLVGITSAAIAQNRAKYDVYGNFKEDEYHKYSTDCCLVPSCNAYGKCYETIECGHVCSSANYPKANTNRTPGYKKKTFYTKYDCRFGECGQFKYTCDHCPDPNEFDFNIYIVRKDCYDCYAYQY